MSDRQTKTCLFITACSSIVVVVLLIVAFVREMSPAWKDVQQKNKEIALDLTENEQRQAVAAQNLQIHQIILDDLDRTDRCMTCHINVNNPLMSSQPLPFRTHSSSTLVDHPVEKFGCTICHGGQGQAVDQQSAHARHPDIQWSRPLIAMQHIQSACGQCHLAIFSNTTSLSGTDIFKKGQKIFSAEGCLGCHKARGVGGSVGPDLTEQGEKTKHEYSFANVAGDHTISNWLFEHFKDPEMVSPGSDMLALQLDDSDVHALVTFTLGMNKPEMPFEYFSVETLNEFKGKRNELDGTAIYPMICSACHGKNGEGKDYEQFETGVAAIGNQDFLAVASVDFLTFTLMNGRGRRQMQAWPPRFSGLKAEEIVRTADFVKARRTIQSSWNQVRALAGNSSRGQKIYEANCRMCHGDDGRAAQIISISNDDFLAVATNEFLYYTIRDGRGNTAMPGWGQLSSQEMMDVISHLRTWQKSVPRHGSFDIANGEVKNGENLYHYRCSRCHGTYGQGDSGPALINKDLLATATDFFLAEMITAGRHGTAMFGWDKDVATADKLSNAQVADILAFLRKQAHEPKEIIYAGTTIGQATSGSAIFEKHCADCHGKNGEGPKAPALNNQELLNAATNGYLYATISLGRYNTKMPSWGRGDEMHAALSIQERHDLVAYIRKWQDVIITTVKYELQND